MTSLYARGAGEERGAEFGERTAIDLGDTHLQQDLLAANSAGKLQQVDDSGLGQDRLCDLAGAEHHVLVDAWPVRITASAVSFERMSSPGKSVCSCRCSVDTPGSTTTSYCARLILTPDDETDRARRLAVDEDLLRRHDGRVGDIRIGDRDPRDVETRCSATNDRQAASVTRGTGPVSARTCAAG